MFERERKRENERKREREIERERERERERESERVKQMGGTRVSGEPGSWALCVRERK